MNMTDASADGFTVALWKAVAKEQKLDYVIRVRPFDEILHGFQSGSIDVLRDKDAVRRVLGYLPQDFGVYPKVSAEDLLDHLARLKGLTKRGERADIVARLLRLLPNGLFDAAFARAGRKPRGLDL